MKKINAKRIAEKLGRDPAFIYRIKRGECKCPVMLAGDINLAARAMADEQGLPPKSLIGWRLADLRPDVIAMVKDCLQYE
jgi:hypothetical protein